jgi:hypothetical protein
MSGAILLSPTCFTECPGTTFFYHPLLFAQHSTQFLCDNIQPCYNVNGIILIINLLLQVLQDSQYFNIGVAAHHLQTGGLLNFLLINEHHKRITEPCVALFSSLTAVLHHQLLSACIGLTKPSVTISARWVNRTLKG